MKSLFLFSALIKWLATEVVFVKPIIKEPLASFVNKMTNLDRFAIKVSFLIEFVNEMKCHFTVAHHRVSSSSVVRASD